MEATGLSIQAKSGTITSAGQERLTVLQAKMDGLLNSRLSHATQFGHNIANIPLRRPQTSTPIQAKLTIGEPGDKYEQEADETARQVVQRIHQSQGEKVQRESLLEKEELQMKPERRIQRESLPLSEDELQMKPMVQRVADRDMATSPDLETSIQQARSGGQPLADNVRKPMEQAFGADFSGVKVHADSQADQLNQSIQAKAFTTGQDVFFRQGEYNPGSRGGQELIAHELTHVVQQKGGAVREPVEGGNQSLGRQRVSGNGGKVIQRYAFIVGKQVLNKDDLTPNIREWVLDRNVRNYLSEEEFEQHANKKTDYLGNLPDGTWLRFAPNGINLLGENHTQVTLKDVIRAVGSTNFIYEQFASDEMANESNIKTAYEAENQAQFQSFGIAQEPNKKQFGAESLFPKMGYGLMLALPFFDGTKNMTDLTTGHYVGQPIQRYLKIAWGYSKDNLLEVRQKQAAEQPIPAKIEALANVHATVTEHLDAFITSLPLDGYIGDAFAEVANAAFLPDLATFAKAFTEAIVEMATVDPSSRLTTEKREALADGNTTDKEKQKLFADWRNYTFEDSVKEAAQRGVRYASMGNNHLKYLLQVGLPDNAVSYDMTAYGQDMVKFKELTKRLAESAVLQKQPEGEL
ncbi:DUF4157 domain-containing protein [Nostoc sp. FACHB-133]|nr:DUF4157 domain-containing protein [Nostoc sp. FACHB-133]